MHLPRAPSAGRQLTFEFAVPEDQRFDTFVRTDNEQLCQRLETLSPDTPSLIYLWGAAGSGRSHLLNATCDHFMRQGGEAILVDGARQAYLNPEMLQGLAEVGLVCIDVVDVFAGDGAWEESLFHLYNQMQGRHCLVFAADNAPVHSAFQLPDLRSRLGACEIYRVTTLPETERAEWLRQGARRRGFELGPGVADYIVHRAPREMRALQSILVTLDLASLSEQRLVTLPFVRQVLGW